MKKFKIAFSILALLILLGAGVVMFLNTKLNALAASTVENVNLTLVSDGVYLGNYGTIPVGVQVEVQVIDHKIVGIRIIKHNNGRGQAAEVLPEHVIQAQSLNVDTITGATYSSKTILLAIADALKKGIK